jgi:hypothetical protein
MIRYGVTLPRTLALPEVGLRICAGKIAATRDLGNVTCIAPRERRAVAGLRTSSTKKRALLGRWVQTVAGLRRSTSCTCRRFVATSDVGRPQPVPKPRHRNLPPGLLLRVARVGNRTALPERRGDRFAAATSLVASVDDEGQAGTARPAVVGCWHPCGPYGMEGTSPHARRPRRRSLRLFGTGPPSRRGAPTRRHPPALPVCV